MSKFSIVTVLVIVGGLALFVLQNSSVSLNLVFLGMSTLALPLGVWISIAVGTGFAIGAAIALLFNWSNYLQAGEPRRRQQANRSTVNYSSRKPSENWQKTGEYPRDSKDNIDNSLPEDSPILKTNIASDPGHLEEEEVSPSSEASSKRSTRHYPERSDSFSASESDNSNNLGVGRIENVYEANYRVIVPPKAPEVTQVDHVDKVEEFDDWETSNLEDDDWN